MFDVTQEVRSEWCVVSLSGRADGQVSDRLDTALQAAVAQHSKVAVDVSGVEYISSAGLRCLLQGARAAQACNAEFVVCAPQTAVSKVFEMSGMQHVLKIAGSLPC